MSKKSQLSNSSQSTHAQRSTAAAAHGSGLITLGRLKNFDIHRTLGGRIHPEIIDAIITFITDQSIETVILPPTLSSEERALIHGIFERAGVPQLLSRSRGSGANRRLTLIRRRYNQAQKKQNIATNVTIEVPRHGNEILKSFEGLYGRLLVASAERQDRNAIASICRRVAERKKQAELKQAGTAEKAEAKDSNAGKGSNDSDTVEPESEPAKPLGELARARIIAAATAEVTGENADDVLLGEFLDDVDAEDLKATESSEVKQPKSDIVFQYFDDNHLTHDLDDHIVSKGILQAELLRRSQEAAKRREQRLGRPERASHPEDYIDFATGRISYTKFPVNRIEDMPAATPIPFMPQPHKNRPTKLPIFQAQDHILAALEEHQVLIVCADTGSGKSTQVPQFLMDYMTAKRRAAEASAAARGIKLTEQALSQFEGRVIVTQPRRIAAVSLAMRVAEERGFDLSKIIEGQSSSEKKLQQVEHKLESKHLTAARRQELEAQRLKINQQLAYSRSPEERETLQDELLQLAIEESNLMEDEENIDTTEADHQTADRQSLLTVRNIGSCEVGYMIRHEYATSKETRAVFMTIGLLLRILCSSRRDMTTAELESYLRYSPSDERYWTAKNSPLVSRVLRGLANVKYLVIDEVHERGKLTDFLLAIIRDVTQYRPDLRIVLMSATIDAEKFSDYFGGAPIIQVPGRTHPVQTFHLHDIIEMTGYLGAGRKLVDFERFLLYHEALGNLPASTTKSALIRAEIEKLPESQRAARAIRYAAETRPLVLRMEMECGLTTAPNPQTTTFMSEEEFTHVAKRTAMRTREVLEKYSFRTRYVADLTRVNSGDYEILVHLLLYITNHDGGFKSSLMQGGSTEKSPSRIFAQAMKRFASQFGTNQPPIPQLPPDLVVSQPNTEEKKMFEFERPNRSLDKGNKDSDEDDAAARLRELIRGVRGDTPAKKQEAAPAPKPKTTQSQGVMVPAATTDDQTFFQKMKEFAGRTSPQHWRGDDNAFELCALLDPQGPPPPKPEFPHGAILVFCPTWAVIQEVLACIQDNPILGDPTAFQVLVMHSSMAMDEQRKVFQTPPPGVWKIILSTNIAETSVTVPDVVYVIDLGLVNQMTFNAETNVSSLLPTWVSQASAIQRTGRAGRVRPGFCFRLYPQTRFEWMAPCILPELLSSSLDDIILYVKSLITPRVTALASGDPERQRLIQRIQRRSMLGEAEAFLARTLEPPLPNAVARALQRLYRLGGLDADERLTNLGRFYSDMPIDPALSRTLLLSIVLGCLDPVLIAVAAATVNQLFPLVPRMSEAAGIQEQTRRRLAGDYESDDLVAINAFYEWASVSDKWRWCRENIVSGTAMKSIARVRNQLFESLRNDKRLSHRLQGLALLGGVMVSTKPHDHANANAECTQLVLNILAAGRYPNIALLGPRGNFVVRELGKGDPKPTRVAALKYGVYSQPLYAYNEILVVSSNYTLLRGLTPLHPLAAAIFAPDVPSGRETEYRDRVRFLRRSIEDQKELTTVALERIFEPQLLENETIPGDRGDGVSPAAAQFMGLTLESSGTMGYDTQAAVATAAPATTALASSALDNPEAFGADDEINVEDDWHRYAINILYERAIEERVQNQLQYSQGFVGERSALFTQLMNILVKPPKNINSAIKDTYSTILANMHSGRTNSPLPALTIDNFLTLSADPDYGLLPSRIRMLRSAVRTLLDEAVSQEFNPPAVISKLGYDMGILLNFLFSNRHTVSIRAPSQWSLPDKEHPYLPNPLVYTAFAKGILCIPSLGPGHANDIGRAIILRGANPRNASQIPKLLGEWADVTARLAKATKPAQKTELQKRKAQLLETMSDLLEPPAPASLPWMTNKNIAKRLSLTQARSIIAGALPDPFATYMLPAKSSAGNPAELRPPTTDVLGALTKSETTTAPVVHGTGLVALLSGSQPLQHMATVQESAMVSGGKTSSAAANAAALPAGLVPVPPMRTTGVDTAQQPLRLLVSAPQVSQPFSGPGADNVFRPQNVPLPPSSAERPRARVNPLSTAVASQTEAPPSRLHELHHTEMQQLAEFAKEAETLGISSANLRFALAHIHHLEDLLERTLSADVSHEAAGSQEATKRIILAYREEIDLARAAYRKQLQKAKLDLAKLKEAAGGKSSPSPYSGSTSAFVVPLATAAAAYGLATQGDDNPEEDDNSQENLNFQRVVRPVRPVPPTATTKPGVHTSNSQVHVSAKSTLPGVTISGNQSSDAKPLAEQIANEVQSWERFISQFSAESLSTTGQRQLASMTDHVEALRGLAQEKDRTKCANRLASVRTSLNALRTMLLAETQSGNSAQIGYSVETATEHKAHLNEASTSNVADTDAPPVDTSQLQALITATKDFVELFPPTPTGTKPNAWAQQLARLVHNLERLAKSGSLTTKEGINRFIELKSHVDRLKEKLEGVRAQFTPSGSDQLLYLATVEAYQYARNYPKIPAAEKKAAGWLEALRGYARAMRTLLHSPSDSKTHSEYERLKKLIDQMMGNLEKLKHAFQANQRREMTEDQTSASISSDSSTPGLTRPSLLQSGQMGSAESKTTVGSKCGSPQMDEKGQDKVISFGTFMEATREYVRLYPSVPSDSKPQRQLQLIQMLVNKLQAAAASPDAYTNPEKRAKLMKLTEEIDKVKARLEENRARYAKTNPEMMDETASNGFTPIVTTQPSVKGSQDSASGQPVESKAGPSGPAKLQLSEQEKQDVLSSIQKDVDDIKRWIEVIPSLEPDSKASAWINQLYHNIDALNKLRANPATLFTYKGFNRAKSISELNRVLLRKVRTHVAHGQNEMKVSTGASAQSVQAVTTQVIEKPTIVRGDANPPDQLGRYFAEFKELTKKVSFITPELKSQEYVHWMDRARYVIERISQLLEACEALQLTDKETQDCERLIQEMRVFKSFVEDLVTRVPALAKE